MVSRVRAIKKEKERQLQCQHCDAKFGLGKNGAWPDSCPNCTAIVLAPQPGPQEQFLSTKADIAVYGGAAGGGKTWALLLEPVRHIHNPQFGGVIFRRESTQITNEGGLWDESHKIFPLFGGSPSESRLYWDFPHPNDPNKRGARLKMAHLQHEKNMLNYQGAQIAYTGWDELTHFTEKQFWYLLSRARSMSGVKPYTRATCNPDAGSWVKKFLAPWVDKNYPMKAEGGEVLWLLRREGEYMWWRDYPHARQNDKIDGLTLRKAKKKYANRLKTVTFVPSSIYDNKKLLEVDPAYLGNLENQDVVERRRLLHGDWDIQEGDRFFEREWFEVVPDIEIPYDDLISYVRYWDLAATERKKNPKACYTAGVLMAQHRRTRDVFILDVKREQFSPANVRELIRNTAHRDGRDVEIYIEQEPGATGVDVIDAYKRLLLGFLVHGDRPSGDKETRAQPLAHSAKDGIIKVRKGRWMYAFLDEIEVYPLGFKDQTDAAAGAFARIADKNRFIMV